MRRRRLRLNDSCWFFYTFVCLLTISSICSAIQPADLPSLDSNPVWFPHKDFPKLTTPQWVGEDGVDCVVVLAIDDMRDPAKYEYYLRPILQRLKKIDGRAPVSIMSCAVKPDDPQLQSWLQEGLSIECHTYSHPCPLMAKSDLKGVKDTYDKCVDLMASIPNNRPVAFRTPCCDSLNTVSPRFYSEIFNKTTPGGQFLQLDSSVFVVYTADDPVIGSQASDSEGRERFRKYIPRKLERNKIINDHFVNIIENYPYPYVMENLCWQFPCMVPSDWSANHLHKPNNPETVHDLIAALDLTVKKQGVMNLVFHPHGWIEAEQVVQLIDHAVTQHKGRVKFLNFHECLDRLNKHLLGERSLRDEQGNDSGLRLADVNRDGFMDVVLERSPSITRIWDPKLMKWSETTSPQPVVQKPPRRLPQNLPIPATVKNRDGALRYVDLNDDEYPDVVFSNHEQFGAWLYEPKDKGWTTELTRIKRGDTPAASDWPTIIRADGTDNGFFVRDRELCWINEDTSELADMMVRIRFDQLLGDRIPEAKSPSAAIKSMRVKPGFQIELVAHEPLTMDPVAFDWGPDGKFWIAEMADYPLGMDGQGAPGGRIRYLEDLDGDGKYDKSTLFLDKVPFPNGVIAWKKGVLVSAAPDVFYAEDTNGDGKADKQEVLFTGFVEGNQQHRANGFCRGLDNWLYMANGDSGGRVKSNKTGKMLDLGGYDLRIRPDTGEMEVVLGPTQFGRNRDDWGNWFGNNNSRPMWHFVLEDRYLKRNPHLAAQNLREDVSESPGAAQIYPSSRLMTRFNDFHTANHFTSACSAIVFRDSTEFGGITRRDVELPSEYNNWFSAHTFVSEPVHNLVHHEIMSRHGTVFRSRRPADENESEFVSSTDNWFRPTMLRTGPDGSLWIADMYRLVIEHPQWIPIEWQQKLNLRAGDDKGRIWRVFPAGSKPRPIPRLNGLTSQQLVEKLDSTNGWQRDLVQQLLVDAAEPTAIPLLRQQALHHANALCRLHSLCTLDGIKSGLNAEFVAQMLWDEHPGVLTQAIRLFEQFHEVDDKTFERLRQISESEALIPVFQLASSLGEFRHPKTGELLGQIAIRQPCPPHIVTAVFSSVTKDDLEDVITSATSLHDNAVGTLPELLEQATAFQLDRGIVKLLDQATKPNADGIFDRWQYSRIDQFQQALGRRGESLSKWIDGLPAADQAITSRLQHLFEVARRTAEDSTANIDNRLSSMQVLGQTFDLKADQMLLASLLTPQQPQEIQQAAVTALGRLDSNEAGLALLESFRSTSPSLRLQIIETLMRREAWREELLNAVDSKRISAVDLDAATRQQLLADRSAAIRERAARLFSANQNTDRAKLVSNYLPTIRKGGDAQRGGQIFQKTCSQCHKLGDVGHIVGPDLSSLADKSAEVLITAVLDPNRAVEARYMTFTAITKQGLTHTGIMTAETSTSITLRAAEAKETTLLRSEIDELISNAKSLMPEGLEKDLKPEDAAALVAYIRQNVPLPVMKSFPGNHPRVVQADAKGQLTLSPVDAEIYGSTIVLEEQHKNLGWWSSDDDMAVWTIIVPKAGNYLVSWTYACDAQAAGNSVAIEAGGKSLTHPVRKTANWDDYQTEQLGQMELPEGEVRLTVKPTRRPLPALADVKTITLKPKE